jgi:hypothetical protein
MMELPRRYATAAAHWQVARDHSGHCDSNELSWAQWRQEEVPVVSNTVTVGPCGTGSEAPSPSNGQACIRVEPTLAMLRTRLAAFDTARRPVGIPNDTVVTPTESHQRSSQPPRHRPGRHNTSTRKRPMLSRPSQPPRPARPAHEPHGGLCSVGSAASLGAWACHRPPSSCTGSVH